QLWDEEVDSGPLAGAVSAVTTGAAGGAAAGVAVAADVTSLVSSVVALRNSRIALPTAPPSSGSRPGPKMMSTTTRMTTSQMGWNGIWSDYMPRNRRNRPDRVIRPGW